MATCHIGTLQSRRSRSWCGVLNRYTAFSPMLYDGTTSGTALSHSSVSPNTRCTTRRSPSALYLARTSDSGRARMLRRRAGKIESALSMYSSRISSGDIPAPSPSAMIPPVLVPTTRSKWSAIFVPVSRSRLASTAAAKIPRTPPPSMDSTVKRGPSAVPLTNPPYSCPTSRTRVPQNLSLTTRIATSASRKEQQSPTAPSLMTRTGRSAVLQLEPGHRPSAAPPPPPAWRCGHAVLSPDGRRGGPGERLNRASTARRPRLGNDGAGRRTADGRSTRTSPYRWPDNRPDNRNAARLAISEDDSAPGSQTGSQRRQASSDTRQLRTTINAAQWLTGLRLATSCDGSNTST